MALLNQADERRGVFHRLIPAALPPRGVGKTCVLPMRRALRKTKQVDRDALPERPKVKFEGETTIVLEDVVQASQMTVDEKRKIWWTEDELEEAFNKIMTITEGLLKRPRNKNSTQPYHSVLYRVNEICRRETATRSLDSTAADDLASLVTWHRNTLSKRGLEKLVLNSATRNTEIRENILRFASASLKESSKREDVSHHETLRKYSERLTLASCLFAQALGRADAECIRPIPRHPRNATEWMLHNWIQ